MLSIYECLGVLDMFLPHLRKLDDRSRTLVHLGTEPGSKTYRLFDPVNRRILVTRDVFFDEENMWKWNTLEKVIDDEPGTFKFTSVNMETKE